MARFQTRSFGLLSGLVSSKFCFRTFFKNQLICPVGSRFPVYLLKDSNSEVGSEDRGVAKGL